MKSPVYFAAIKYKVRPVVVVDRGERHVRIMIISSSLPSNKIVSWKSPSGKNYTGYLHTELKIIKTYQLLRFIGMVEI